MTLRSPIVAMLWENWQLTRVEAVWKLASGIVGGLAALVVFAAFGPNEIPKAVRDVGAVIALTLIVIPNVLGWWSIGSLNRVRAGFPFYVHYTRPVRTALLVGVPMVYGAAVPAASYLVAALFLRVVSGYPFPLLPVAAWIAALNLAHAPTNWPIRNTVGRLLANMVVGVTWINLAMHRLTAVEVPGLDWPPDRWPAIFDFPRTDYVVIAAIGLVSFGVTVVAVARQRHGDAPATSWTPGAGFPERLVNLFRFRCPTSSATRAQVWFELKSRGLPVLAIGLVLAIMNPLLFALSVPIERTRVLVNTFAMVSVLTVLILAGNAFGLRWRQGRVVYVSAFEATLPCGTAWLAGLKVFVRSVCMLGALVAVGVSVWASLSFIAVGRGSEPLRGYQPLRSWQEAIDGGVGVLTGYQQVALSVVAALGIAVIVAAVASSKALAARYPRRLGIGIAGWLLLLHGFVLVPLVMVGYRGYGSVAIWDFLLKALVWMTRWIDAPAIVLATGYVFWKALAERQLTLRQTCGTALVSATFVAAWLTTLHAAGVSLADMAVTDVVWMLSPALLPLMASVLAPWSLNRVRHL